MGQPYNERLNRYLTAMRNEKPDNFPIRPFVAEFTAKYAGFTCQDVARDYEKVFIAALKSSFSGPSPAPYPRSPAYSNRHLTSSATSCVVISALRWI